MMNKDEVITIDLDGGKLTIKFEHSDEKVCGFAFSLPETADDARRQMYRNKHINAHRNLFVIDIMENRAKWIQRYKKLREKYNKLIGILYKVMLDNNLFDYEYEIKDKIKKMMKNV